MISEKSPFVCPVCRGILFKSGGQLSCLMGHSFNIAKQGYVNLLMKNSSRKRHGDDKLMVMSRRNFLLKGYYEPLRNELSKTIGKNQFILDAGCGEGYYTSAFERQNNVCGIDISKDAVKYAAACCKNSDFAVASISDIPLADGSVDVTVSIFAPDSNDEFLRVSAKKGRLITVMPMEKHLLELKKMIYDMPYLNPPVNTEREGFELISATPVKYSITLESNEDIVSLFKMTPYYYKTSLKDQKKAENISSLTTQLEFFIAEYRKI